MIQVMAADLRKDWFFILLCELHKSCGLIWKTFDQNYMLEIIRRLSFYFATYQIIRCSSHVSLQSKGNEMQLSFFFPINWLYSNFEETFVLAARSNCMKWSDKRRLSLRRH